MREASGDIVERLRRRRSEIEEVVLTGIRAVPDPVAEGDAEYFEGQRAKVVALLDYGLAGIEQAGQCPEPIPSPVLAQARRAARLGVRQQLLLRRCLTYWTSSSWTRRSTPACRATGTRCARSERRGRRCWNGSSHR